MWWNLLSDTEKITFPFIYRSYIFLLWSNIYNIITDNLDWALKFSWFLTQDAIPLSFYIQPDGPLTSNGSFKSSVLVPGYAHLLFSFIQYIHTHIISVHIDLHLYGYGRGKEAFYVGPPTKEKLPKVPNHYIFFSRLLSWFWNVVLRWKNQVGD